MGQPELPDNENQLDQAWPRLAPAWMRANAARYINSALFGVELITLTGWCFGPGEYEEQQNDPGAANPIKAVAVVDRSHLTTPNKGIMVRTTRPVLLRYDQSTTVWMTTQRMPETADEFVVLLLFSEDLSASVEAACYGSKAVCLEYPLPIRLVHDPGPRLEVAAEELNIEGLPRIAECALRALSRFAALN